MNNFLQRMLKRSDDESEGDKVAYDNKKQQVECSPRSSKSNWMRKLGACSPSKREISSSMKSPARTIIPNSAGHRYDRCRNVPEPLTLSEDSIEMPDLEKIILEFEQGYLSPTKQEPKGYMKSGRFVKQIVAAYEEKYKVYNAYKMEAELSSNEPSGAVKKVEKNGKCSKKKEQEASTSLMGQTYVIETMESQFHRYMDNSEAESEAPTSRSNESIDLGMCSFAMDEELTVSTPTKKSKGSSTPRSTKSMTLNGTMMLESPETTEAKPVLRSNSSIRRERQPKIVGAFLKKPIEVDDTSVDWIPIIGKKLPRKTSFKRLLCLLTGKKWDDNTSELYSSETNVQKENKPQTTTRELHDSGYEEKTSSTSSLTSLISISDILLQQENYEIQTEHKPLTTFKRSQPVIIDKNSENEMSTSFRQSFAADAEQQCVDVVPTDDASDTCSITSKKIFLEEVPRSEVRLSLGPAFPTGPRVTGKSSDRVNKNRSTVSQDLPDNLYDEVPFENLPPAPPLTSPPASPLTSRPVSPLTSPPASPLTSRPVSPLTSPPASPLISPLASPLTSPLASPLPKHPFVSLKRDEDQDSLSETDKDINFNDFNDIKLRRKITTWKNPSPETIYDTPRCVGNVRKYMSRSEPGLITIGRANNKPSNEVIYDVPKANIPERPKSSVYEDALSLKRRNAYFSYSPPGSSYYAFPNEVEPHYATVKPRRIYTSRELTRSMESLSDRDLKKYYCRAFDDIRTF